MSQRIGYVRAASLLVSLLAAWALLVSFAGSAVAADRIFLKIGDIKGESTDDKHKDEIDVLSFSQSFTRPGTCSDFTIFKGIDRASPPLIASALTQTIYPTAELKVDRQGESPAEYLI